jgi:hypothetical protein
VGRVRTLKRALQSDGRPAYLRKSSFEVSMNTSGTPDTIEAVPKHYVSHEIMIIAERLGGFVGS